MLDNIRPFSPTDMDKVIQIYAQSKLDELQFESTHFELLPLTEDTSRYSALMASTILVMENQDGQVVGFGAYFIEEETTAETVIEIRGLFVSPQARGKGIGQALLQAMLALEPVKQKTINLHSSANTKRQTLFRLYIATSNAIARRLYEKHGFQTMESFETEYNGQPVMADRMEWLKAA